MIYLYYIFYIHGVFCENTPYDNNMGYLVFNFLQLMP